MSVPLPLPSPPPKKKRKIRRPPIFLDSAGRPPLFCVRAAASVQCSASQGWRVCCELAVGGHTPSLLSSECVGTGLETGHYSCCCLWQVFSVVTHSFSRSFSHHTSSVARCRPSSQGSPLPESCRSSHQEGTRCASLLANCQVLATSIKLSSFVSEGEKTTTVTTDTERVIVADYLP